MCFFFKNYILSIFYWFHKIYCRLVLLVCEIASGPSFPRVEGCRWPRAGATPPQSPQPPAQTETCWKTREKPALPEGDWQESPQWTTQRVLFCTHFYKCKMELIQTGFGGRVQLSPFFTQMLTDEEAQQSVDGVELSWVKYLLGLEQVISSLCF